MISAGRVVDESALLRGVPRTATVRALVPTTIYTISCRDFHEAISGPTSSAIANRVAADHLARGTPAGA